MKKVFSIFLVCALVLSMTGCTEAPVAAESTQPAETVAETTGAAETVAETTGAAETVMTTDAVTEPTAPAISGTLYLTVSAITFSVVGETEDVYVGSVPREAVTWSVADESVATFHNGILTATGVGTTTAVAEFEDQRVECTVGCLAETEEKLMTISRDILRSPKRYPSVDPQGIIPYFADAAIVGDSISYVLFQIDTAHDSPLGNPTYLVRGGSGILGFIDNTWPMVYQGKEMLLEDAISLTGVKKIFIMLGQNDLGFMSVEDTIRNWKILIERIEEKNPGLTIFVQSVLPESYSDIYTHSKNLRISEYNRLLKEYAEQKGHYYLDIARYVEDHQGYLAEIYSQADHIHMEQQGCLAWIQVLKTYAIMTELSAQ